MNKVTVTFTKDQATFIANVLEANWVESDTPASKNMFDIRIINKIRKALEGSNHKKSADLINSKAN